MMLYAMLYISMKDCKHLIVKSLKKYFGANTKTAKLNKIY